jgi:hypothetical protein
MPPRAVSISDADCLHDGSIHRLLMIGTPASDVLHGETKEPDMAAFTTIARAGAW